jgi:site-specific DNA-cytosine methylase
VLSAFTGAGGLDLGLHRAGFSSLGAIERDVHARSTIVENGLWPLLNPADIVEVAKTLRPATLGLKVRELDLLAGAPPCQPFSKAAQWAQSGRAGLADERSGCVGAFFELISRFLPAVVLLENVPGFVQGKTSALPVLDEKFAEINRKSKTKYQILSAVLDACDYGVPQHRERAILIALRDGGEFWWPEVTHADSPVSSFEAIGDLNPAVTPVATGKWAGLLPSVPEGSNYLFHTPEGDGLPLFGNRTRFWSFLLKLSKREPSWTLPAQPGPATGPFHWTSRPLAIEELLRLQSFPSSWKVSGGHRDQVRQIGNATPPLLAEVIGRAIGQQVFGKIYRDDPTLAIRRVADIPRAQRRAQVPAEYRSLRGAHPSHAGPGKGPRPRAAAS